MDPVFEMIQRLTEPPPPYPCRSPKSTRANRKSRRSSHNYNLSNLHIKRSIDGSEPDHVSFELTFAPDPTGASQIPAQTQPGESNDLTNFILPMMLAARDAAGPISQESEKNKIKKAPKEDDPFEAYAKKLWESMSDGVSCSCRKGKLLEALRKDRDTLQQNELHLRAQIGSYKMFQSVMSDEFQKQDLGVVLVVGEDSNTGQSALKYKLEKKTTENCADIEALGELLKQLQAFL